LSEREYKSYNNDRMMQIGYNEFSSNVSASEAISRCKRMGLASLQINGDFPVNFPENISDDQRREAKNLLDEHEIRLHYHSPTDIPLASRHHHLRLSGVERLIEYIGLAIDLGAKTFVFHPGRFAYYKISSGRVVVGDREIPEVYFKRFYDSAEKLAKFSSGKIDLLLENTYNFSPRLIKIVDDFLQLPSTGLVWDIGHMHHGISSQFASNAAKTRIAEFFSGRLDFIKLAHIHDVAGRKGHLALGTGEIDLESYIDIIGKLGVEMIIEVFSEKDLKTSLSYIQGLTVNT
jgi:sugar phosphate isomerase/epimerase